MHRLALLAFALAASATPAFAAAPPSPSVSLRACRTASDPLDRYAIFRSDMRAVRGAARMGVRFDLLAHADEGDVFAPVTGPNLGVWNLSKPGVDAFRFSKRVANLAAPGAYRARVSFRWYDASGKVIRRRTRFSPVCTQPDPRANLTVEAITAEPVAQPGLVRYLVTIANHGQQAAPSLELNLIVDRAEIPTASTTVAGLGVGQVQTVSFVARRCREGGSVKAVVDPANRIAESDESDGSRTVGCPTLSRR